MPRDQSDLKAKGTGCFESRAEGAGCTEFRVFGTLVLDSEPRKLQQGRFMGVIRAQKAGCFKSRVFSPPVLDLKSKAG